MSVLAALSAQHDEMLEDLRAFVERETPSDDKAALDAFAAFLRDFAAGFGSPKVDVIAVPSAGNHVRIAWSGVTNQRPLLLVGHYDTVWPIGTLRRLPFTVSDGKARGPGIFDMKAGLVQAFWAIRTLLESGPLPRPVVMLVNSDEEIGSPTSRAIIEQEASNAAAALVLEPSERGALKTARKAVGIFQVDVEGRATHAGLDPFGGVSAVEELSRITLALQALSERERGVSVTVGTFHGGTRTNVVPEFARATVDLRAVTQDDAQRVADRILATQPHNPEAHVRVTGGINRPAMERSDSIARLFQRAQTLAHEHLGLSLDEIAVGGGSDGNFCAYVGCPVLDGLGAVGAGAHAITEHIEIAQLPVRAALLATLIRSL